VDDHSRLAYSEIHADERKETAVAFWERARAFFTGHAITVERVLTDNGSCYRSHAWRQALAAAGITHKRTRLYRPQTNGKVERFNRTLLNEWAYLRPYTSNTERAEAFAPFLHAYNYTTLRVNTATLQASAQNGVADKPLGFSSMRRKRINNRGGRPHLAAARRAVMATSQHHQDRAKGRTAAGLKRSGAGRLRNLPRPALSGD
jgi:hypothetical protein